jgi:hypothetical protein
VLTACGSDKKSSSAAASFCNDVRALGSLSKGTQDAMAMSPTESAKDFTALASKVTALEASAPASLAASIKTVGARFTLEAKAETMMAANPKGAAEETQMLDAHKTADDAAIARVIAGAKARCNVDIS